MADNTLKIWQEAASAGKDCLNLETLERLADNPSSDAKAAAHLAGCAHCQTELAMLQSFEAATPSPDEGAAVAWITSQLQRRQPGAPRQAPVVRVSFWRNLFRVPYLAGAAAVALILIVAISLYQSGSVRPQPGPSAGIIYRNNQVRLQAPLGDLTQPANEFRWEAVPGAASYKVQLSDVLDQMIASATSTQPELAVTPEMKAAMRPGVPLLWKVIALDASGKTIAESTGGKFRVKR